MLEKSEVVLTGAKVLCSGCQGFQPQSLENKPYQIKPGSRIVFYQDRRLSYTVVLVLKALASYPVMFWPVLKVLHQNQFGQNMEWNNKCGSSIKTTTGKHYELPPNFTRPILKVIPLLFKSVSHQFNSFTVSLIIFSQKGKQVAKVVSWCTILACTLFHHDTHANVVNTCSIPACLLGCAVHTKLYNSRVSNNGFSICEYPLCVMENGAYQNVTPDPKTPRKNQCLFSCFILFKVLILFET